MGTALHSIQVAKSGGIHPQAPALGDKSPFVFSFSDTFVLVSHDISREAVASFLITSAVLTQYLFAQCLGVRGAIVFGEADFIPSTQHLIGKGIVSAAELEKKQDWIGVTVDLSNIPAESHSLFEQPAIAPLFTRWNVPIKDGKVLENALVINWRYNLYVEGGTKSLFSNPAGYAEKLKIKNTLNFAKHLVDGGKAYGRVMNADGTEIPWLKGCNVRSLAWAKRPERFHGDDY